MPHWLLWFLLVLFTVHFVAFAMLLVRRRKAKYAVLCGIFLFLVSSFALRLGIPEAELGGLKVYWYPRIAAWTLTFSLILSYIRRRIRQPRSE